MDGQSQNAALTIHGQFIKDLSLEIPHAPEIFGEIKSAPKMDVHVDVKSEPKGNGMFTSQLDISMTGKVEDKTLFVLELSYTTAVTRNEGAMAIAGTASPPSLLLDTLAELELDCGMSLELDSGMLLLDTLVSLELDCGVTLELLELSGLIGAKFAVTVVSETTVRRYCVLTRRTSSCQLLST